jgi:hypothetical protein
MTNKIQKQISYGKIQILLKEKFEDIKGVIRSLTSQDRNTMVKRKRTNGQAMIYKTLQGKQKNEQYELHYKRG